MGVPCTQRGAWVHWTTRRPTRTVVGSGAASARSEPRNPPVFVHNGRNPAPTAPPTSQPMRQRALALVVLLAFPVAVQAQKKALTQADWDKWKSINAPTLSPDGKWAVYTLIPQVGDGELVVRSTSGSTEYHVPRGFIGRPNNTPGGLRGPAGAGGPEEGGPVGPTATPAQITADSRFVIVQTQAPQAEVERTGRGRGAAAANRQSLVIMSLPDGKTTTIAGVRSFRLARDNGTWLAYVAEDSAAAGDSSRAPVQGAAGGGRGGRGGRGGGSGRARRAPPVRQPARAPQSRDGRGRAPERRERIRVRRQREGDRATPSCRAIRRKTAPISARWAMARRRRCSAVAATTKASRSIAPARRSCSSPTATSSASRSRATRSTRHRRKAGQRRRS